MRGKKQQSAAAATGAKLERRAFNCSSFSYQSREETASVFHFVFAARLVTIGTRESRHSSCPKLLRIVVRYRRSNRRRRCVDR